MDIDDVVSVLDAVSRLIGALALPLVVLVVFVWLGPSIKKLIDRTDELSFKGAGIEATFKQKQAEVTGALVAASVSKATPTTPEASTREAQTAAIAVGDALTPGAVRRASAARVLWVDNHPENNVLERRAFEAAGVTIVIAKSTDAALEQVEVTSFDAIISDLGRGLQRKAGFDLLEKLRARGDKTPYVIYAGSAEPDLRAEAKRKGAVDATNRPDELFRLVMNAIGTHPSR
ncbi:MAG TPA: response regulator [Candidatus Limnocylindrales bacterium]|nr:response regulator [Candidatus Limnocylindrales bacterium]